MDGKMEFILFPKNAKNLDFFLPKVWILDNME
jgi:hypothetical protein